MDLLKQLLGRLHPIIVHLPIGFIILGLLLSWVDRKEKEFTRVIVLIFFWGGVSAVLACITGYLQYLGEGYAFDTIKLHLWMGIATAIFSFLMYLRLSGPLKLKFLKQISRATFAIVLFILISLTGHLGGSITHGKDYLVEPLPNSIKSALGFETYAQKTIVLNEENWEETLLYADLIAPILNNNCVSCHNPKKSKGELHLNSKEGILKGGENGEVITLENPKKSPLYARLILPRDHEDHMPPKDKTQPTNEQIQLIETWIEQGNPFDKSVGELGLNKVLLQPFFPKKPNEDFPDVVIEAASLDTINQIKQQGIHVENISKSSNFLRVSCINKPSFNNEDFDNLMPVAKQITVLDLGGTEVSDAIFEKLSGLPHLTILKLDNTDITGKDLEKLQNLEYLRILNLTHTSFEKPHLIHLSKFKKLQSVYLYNTGLTAADSQKNASGKPVKIEYGNYELPPLPSDSISY